MPISSSEWVNDRGYDKFTEFFGMPASGKSTLVKKMKVERDDLIDVNEIVPKPNLNRQLFKVKCILICLIFDPIIFLKDTKIIMFSKQNNFKDLLTVLSNWFVIIYLYRKGIENHKYYHVLDQGLFQALWSIAFSAKKDFNMDQLLENKPLPKNIYFINVSNDILIKRAIERNTALRLDYKKESNINKGRIALEKVVKCMKKNGYRTT